MSTVRTEHYQPVRPQNVALQRLDASRRDLILLSHLLQASLIVERNNPLRQAITDHWTLARACIVGTTLLASLAAGLIIPHFL